MKPPSIESGGAELPLGIAQRLLYGVILPNLCLLGLGALHWLILLPVSQGESKGWNLIILFYYIPIIAGISTLVSCWVLWRSAFSRSEQFVLGLRVPVCSYGVILVFTLYLYWGTSR